MATRRNKRLENLLSWVAVGIALIAAIILDKDATPSNRWHAAIMWTVVAFYTAIIWVREKWRSWRFWLVWAACLIVHVFAMWLIFARLVPRLVIGILYVYPLAFVESVLVAGIIAKLSAKRVATSLASHSNV